METTKIYILKREVKLCESRDLVSWIREQDIESSTKNSLLKLSQTSGSYLKPDDLLDRYDLKEALEWLEKYLDWLKNTPYSVVFENHTSDFFDDVAWAYQLRSGIVGMKAGSVLPPGTSLSYAYSSCIEIYSYAFALYIGNQNVYQMRTMTVGEINDYESQQYGQIAMCDDVWHIYVG